MKQFLIEWCKSMIIALVMIWYISIFFMVCYLLDDNTLKKILIYIFLWVVFYAVTTVTCYVRYYKK